MKMLGKEPKRYSVARTAEGYEVRDADAAGAQVFFSASRKTAREMARELNRKPGNDEKRADQWKSGFPGDFG
jgi:hypothetical protein